MSVVIDRLLERIAIYWLRASQGILSAMRALEADMCKPHSIERQEHAVTLVEQGKGNPKAVRLYQARQKYRTDQERDRSAGTENAGQPGWAQATGRR